MAWTYSAWRRQGTPRARLDMLNLHLEELSNAVTAEISGDGKSRSSQAIRDMIRDLEKERVGLEAVVGGSGGGISYGRFKA